MNNFDIKKSIGYLLSMTNASMRMCFNKKLKESGINTSTEQWGLLNIIKANPGQTQSELADVSLKDKTNVTRMLDVLEKNKLIVRKNDKKDRRAYRIYISEDGERLVNRIVPIANAVNEKALLSITEEEQTLFVNLLEKISRNALR